MRSNKMCVSCCVHSISFFSHKTAQPQLLCRGAYFGFLPSLQSRPSLVRPDPGRIVRDVGDNNGEAGNGRRVDAENLHIDAVKSMRAEYATLLTRWKGLALTPEAELQAPPHDVGNIVTLPWANNKFASYPSHGGTFPTFGSSR